MEYNKSFLDLNGQLNKIKIDYNFTVDDDDEIKKTLNNLNYYKLKGYMHPLIKSSKTTSINFSEVIDTFYFDKKLRLFIFKILEEIEISLKAKVALKISNETGTFGYLDISHFNSQLGHGKYFDHKSFLTNVNNYQKRSKEDFMNYYKNKYSKSPNVPIWMMVELLPFGDLSRFYEAYKKNKVISKDYELSPKILSSWLHRLSLIRNYCAHNSRLWNRKYNQVTLKDGWKYHSWVYLEGTLYFLKYIMGYINPSFDFSDIKNHIEDFITKYPDKAKYMGIDRNDKLKYLI